MINRIIISTPRPFPVALRYNNIRSYVLTATFILLAVMTPCVFHQFHLAGPTFLPMHIFVLSAGLLFGWRAGLIVGVLTPFTSYAVSGMPALSVLPQIVVELSAYGSIAGILREKYHLRTMWSLLGAMIGGRVALFLAVMIIYLIAERSYSPLGLETSPFAAFWSTIRQGWPGIITQLISTPAIVLLAGKLAGRKH